jgi:hypothetical protein
VKNVGSPDDSGTAVRPLPVICVTGAAITAAGARMAGLCRLARLTEGSSGCNQDNKQQNTQTSTTEKQAKNN